MDQKQGKCKALSNFVVSLAYYAVLGRCQPKTALPILERKIKEISKSEMICFIIWILWLSTKKVAWPSGLRRWFKAPVTSVARVRIPPLPNIFFLQNDFTFSLKLSHFSSLQIKKIIVSIKKSVCTREAKWQFVINEWKKSSLDKKKVAWFN